jgi:hypothetical protein
VGLSASGLVHNRPLHSTHFLFRTFSGASRSGKLSPIDLGYCLPLGFLSSCLYLHRDLCYSGRAFCVTCTRPAHAFPFGLERSGLRGNFPPFIAIYRTIIIGRSSLDYNQKARHMTSNCKMLRSENVNKEGPIWRRNALSPRRRMIQISHGECILHDRNC